MAFAVKGRVWNQGRRISGPRDSTLIEMFEDVSNTRGWLEETKRNIYRTIMTGSGGRELFPRCRSRASAQRRRKSSGRSALKAEWKSGSDDAGESMQEVARVE